MRLTPRCFDFAQHDKEELNATPYCHSERSEESSRQAKQAFAKIVATIENSERKRATKQII